VQKSQHRRFHGTCPVLQCKLVSNETQALICQAMSCTSNTLENPESFLWSTHIAMLGPPGQRRQGGLALGGEHPLTLKP
jgi:hypothetical protein